MTYPLPWLNVLAFSGCRLARCCSVESMMITIFQGRPLSRSSGLANCRAGVLERLSIGMLATLELDSNSLEKRDRCVDTQQGGEMCFASTDFGSRAGLWL